ncbi:family 10 glycosylhydrolase [Lipingzhangella sp. LS1_29]|uniref:Family 10 glycosylhydrolase n=1 Tax=Lipingzhangella rawalii TaxID=2055835 RepID=A0ABU2H8D0_9ACTN|nr:family 10 glycosylhydrolase [Lipingzhangella rawalii]MDS1271568.1 family 10 glycosylhydrolase [Lipingzhangella rawalii]
MRKSTSVALAASIAAVTLVPLPATAAGSASQNGQECSVQSSVPDKHQMRAEWIAGVYNIDWPSAAGLDVAEQQAELRELYDEAVDNGLNAVFVQIRPTADTFWPSEYEPWSEWLTGEQGADPGYDPLEFAIEEAHERNLEFHGWFNPYRVAMHDDPERLVDDHPARQNPDWVFAYGGQLYYDPGIPEAREFVQDAMMDAVENYDMDGAHFDDYFYPYPVDGEEIPDAETFAEHGGEFDNIGDWRRDNVNRLIEEFGERVSAAKPHVKFGVSPFGIWRNADSDPDGSATSGLESYDAIYADSRTWVREEWVDYINPQVYWEIGLEVADYAELVPWWADVVAGTNVQLYIGQAAYKVGGAGWEDPTELSQHLTFNRDYPEVAGDVYFSATSLRTNAAEAMEIVVDEHYTHPALVPVHDGLGGEAPPDPLVRGATHDEETGTELRIISRDRDATAYYAVYRFDGPPQRPEQVCALADPRTMVGTVRADGTETTFLDEQGTHSQTYYVTALDRLHHESGPSRPVHVR